MPTLKCPGSRQPTDPDTRAYATPPHIGRGTCQHCGESVRMTADGCAYVHQITAVDLTDPADASAPQPAPTAYGSIPHGHRCPTCALEWHCQNQRCETPTIKPCDRCQYQPAERAGILRQVGDEAFVVVDAATDAVLVSPRYRFLAEEAAADYEVRLQRTTCPRCGAETNLVQGRPQQWCSLDCELGISGSAAPESAQEAPVTIDQAIDQAIIRSDATADLSDWTAPAPSPKAAARRNGADPQAAAKQAKANAATAKALVREARREGDAALADPALHDQLVGLVGGEAAMALLETGKLPAAPAPEPTAELAAIVATEPALVEMLAPPPSAEPPATGAAPSFVKRTRSNATGATVAIWRETDGYVVRCETHETFTRVATLKAAHHERHYPQGFCPQCETVANAPAPERPARTPRARGAGSDYNRLVAKQEALRARLETARARCAELEMAVITVGQEIDRAIVAREEAAAATPAISPAPKTIKRNRAAAKEAAELLECFDCGASLTVAAMAEHACKGSADA